VKIRVHVSPNSREARVVKIGETIYDVKVDEKPLGGRANKRLLEILSDYFKIPKSKIFIVSGTKSREKIVQIISDDNANSENPKH